MRLGTFLCDEVDFKRGANVLVYDELKHQTIVLMEVVAWLSYGAALLWHSIPQEYTAP